MKKIKNWLLRLIIEVHIKYGWYSNRNTFKPGDKVKYNWKAKVYIASAIKDRLGVMVVYKYLYKDNSGLEFINGECCDPYWVSKI